MTMALSASGPVENQSAASWPTEVVLLRGADAGEVVARTDALLARLAKSPGERLADLAYSLNTARVNTEPGATLAVVAADVTELARRLTAARDHLRSTPQARLRDPSGSYYEPQPLARQGQLAVLFPGEGTQYVGMMADLRGTLAAVERQLALADAAIGPDGEDAHPVSRFFLPAEALPVERREQLERRLRQVDYAMFAVLTADMLALDMLERLGVTAGAVAGHSAGELAALSSAGSIDPNADVAAIVAAMRDLGEAEERDEHGEAILLAAAASRETIARIIAETLPADVAAGPHQAVFVAMDNCPHQAVIVGWPGPVVLLEAELKRRKILCDRLPFSRPYHTPLFAPFMGPLTEMFDEVAFRAPRRRVYSCTTAKPFPSEPEAVRALALAHWSSPVEFSRLVEAMYDDGYRVFVEAGPRGVLSAFVADILRGREFVAVPCDLPRRASRTQWNHVVGQLAAQGVGVDPACLYSERMVQRLDGFGWPDRMAGGGSPVGASEQEPTPRVRGGTARSRAGQVLARHMTLMERMLDDQRAIFKDYLHTRAGRGPHQAAPAQHRPGSPVVAQPPQARATAPSAAPPAALPLAGTIVRHTPGVELLIRRRLDLAEDRYADDHTVGGRDVSRMNPQQRGMPVVPMTFILEMMAEAAVQFVPGYVAIAVGDVQIQRWLPVDEESVSTTEIEARRCEQAAAVGTVNVQVEVRDLGPASEAGGAPRGTVAAGRVTLARSYPPAPRASDKPFTNQQPCRITLATLYRNLFHGGPFQAVTSLDAFGDEGLAATIEVRPRDTLFRSTSDPQFLIDPVTVDVGMHPAAGWHLEQPDQAGRVLLPFEMKRIEFFGPSPPVGTRLKVTNLVVHASPRQFTHAGEIALENGALWCRLTGVKCWRFYLPLCEVNFNGPKDEYFVCKPWPDWPGDGADDAEMADVHCVRLDPTGDLSQSAMQDAAARITLSARELRAWRDTRSGVAERTAWLFGRIAIKDAVRLDWYARTGEQHFIADLDVYNDQYGRPAVRLRNETRPARFPAVAMAQGADRIFALAGPRRWLGAGIARADGGTHAELDEEEAQLLAELPGDGASRQAAVVAARDALRQALGAELVPARELLRVRGVDRGGQRLLIALEAELAALFPDLNGEPAAVRLLRDGDYVVAIVCGPRNEGQR